MNKDQIKGQVKEVVVSVKEATGKILGDKSLEAKGIAEKIVGKVQAEVGNIKSDLKDILKLFSNSP
ncbi:CsbD family protein [Polynucleobacter rarus]|uniref:CsbD family protein n=1 Tax=Polynucleobacter rarus TaxID=556055 RepID=UPI000D3EA6F6|nr:CsbD family protein [Polynucleobacter rarus]